MDTVLSSFLSPRRCFLEPIPEIFEAQKLLDEAATAHCVGDDQLAEQLIVEADIPAIARWTDSIWGKRNTDVLRIRKVENSPPWLPKEARPHPRMPDMKIRRLVISRDGHHCRFCGIPVIDSSVRTKLHRLYPKALRWGPSNAQQHAAFQCMWLQYDHLLPNSRGGASSLENLVVTCAACNFGRMEMTLEEVGISDPRNRPIVASTWDGLERVLHDAD